MEMQIFENGSFGQVRIVEKKGEPWFVAKDVCDILGLSNVSEALTSLDLDEKTDISGSDVGSHISKLRLVSESGLYDLIFKSRKPEAKTFRKWVTSEVLPSIRKTGSYTTKSNLDKVPDVKYDFLIADELASFLKCSETSRLKIARKIFVKHSCDLTLLPEYVENTQPCLSATDLLKKYEVGIGAAAFNKLMLAAGLLEEHSRRSRTSDKVKKFKALSKEGMEYGQNDTSDQNPNETQPRYFVHKFENLLEKLNLK